MSHNRKDSIIYKSFVGLAILGKLPEADHMMKEPTLRRSILRVAGDLQQDLPPQIIPLFRGILLNPPVNPNHVANYQDAGFVSFSEDHDVGCWFARPESFMAEEYIKKHTTATGWLGIYTPASISEFVFHWSWEDILNQSSPNLYEVAQRLALQNNEDPSDWVYQIYFNLKHQKEVMLKPGMKLSLTPVDQAGCPAAPILDKRLRPRPDFVIAPDGLQSLGIQPQTKLYLIDADFPKPLGTCPVCAQAGITVIYYLDRANIRVYSCSLCNQKSFAI